MPNAETPQRTTLILPPELHKRLKLLAVERGATLTDLFTEALEQYLRRAEAKPTAKKGRARK